MAAANHPHSRGLTASCILGVTIAITLGGCASKQERTLPPTPPAQVEPQISADTIKSVPAVPDTQLAARPLRSGWIFKALVNVRSEPSTQAPIITKLSRGTEVKLIDKAEQWWRVQMEDTSTAYIHESMISLERYLDPWTQFKLNGRLADTTLQIVTAVTDIKDSEVPSAALTVGDSWDSFSKIKKQRVAQAAFAYWKVCLSKAGYDAKGTAVVLRDAEGVDLVRVTGNSDKTSVDFLH